MTSVRTVSPGTGATERPGPPPGHAPERLSRAALGGALTPTERKAGIDRKRLIDRAALVQLAWQHGHPYPPEYSSVNLALFLRRRGVGVFR